MKGDRVFESVEQLFGDIFRYAETQNGEDPTWGFSDQTGVRLASSAFKQMLLSLLPKGISEEARKAFYFAVADISA
jgi:hypothetical protein